MFIQKSALAFALAGVLVAGAAGATTYSDNFTGGAATQKWIALSDACLTAGTLTGESSETNPIIPGCNGRNDTNGDPLPTDPTDQGALLLTPAVNSQTGAILSDFTFPMSQGLQVTFTTYSYGSTSNGAPAHIGADGITFFLMDGTKPVPGDTGATGGAMGYDCSVTNFGGVKKYEGIANGYLGLGMDEWGNFLNNGDNGSVGVLNTNADGAPPGHGGNTWSNGFGTPGDSSGKNYQPNRIGMRGAGNVNRAGLNALNPDYYPLTGDQHVKVMAACKSGTYVAKDGTNKTMLDYNPIPGAYKALPNNQPIADVAAKKIADAWPITYKVTISANGLLNFAYSYNNGDFQTVLANSDISKINGVPPSLFRFGFSAGTGGQNNVHEITCFKASPLQANSSAGSNTVTGKFIPGMTQIFLPAYSSNGWWGSLGAYSLVDDGGELAIKTDANWDAKCVLGGPTNPDGTVPCDTMGVDKDGKPINSVTPEKPSDRTLLTSDDLGASKGVALKWGSLSTAQQTALKVATSNALDATPGQNRVAWLRGDRSVEQLYTGCTAVDQASPVCDMRARTYVLGDIINSSPTFVGAPTSGAYPNAFHDDIDASAPVPENAKNVQTYSTFAADNASRMNMVYVGSNDGFVHGFRSGVESGGSLTNNDGKELVGYMPYDVLLDKAVNLADPLYKHNYLVDATPTAGDVFYNKAWHTLLVGGVGSSGQEIYALDITDPTSMDATKVMGDWDSSTLTHLGNTVGTPIIARLHNGDWAFIFGSGLHKNNDGTVNNNTTAGVYIGLIDSGTGAVTFQFLDTKVGSATSPDGIAYVSSVDLDGDHITDYLYAGDTQGNVWRFDVTSDTTSDWKVSTFGTSAPKPLFTAKDADGNTQPITTAITPLAIVTGSNTRAMLYFGTGQETQATDTNGVGYATGTQTFYGIWDWNMANWDTLSTMSKYAKLTGSHTFTRDDLLAQTVDGTLSDATHRYLSTTKVVCWEGDAVTPQCPTEDQYGWMFDLPGKPTKGEYLKDGEQAIYNATYLDGAIVVNTAIPPDMSAADCNPGQQTGWTMAFNPLTGGGFTEGFFADAGGGFSSGDSTVGGTMVSGVGTPTQVCYGGKCYLVTQTITGAAKLFRVNPPGDNNPSRVSWRELVNP